MDLGGFAETLLAMLCVFRWWRHPKQCSGMVSFSYPGDLAFENEGKSRQWQNCLADMDVNVGVDTGAGCSDWLVMNVVGEVGLKVSDGTK